MAVVRDDDEERLARIQQMIEDLRPPADPMIEISQQLRIDAENSRLALEQARKRASRARAESAAQRATRKRPKKTG